MGERRDLLRQSPVRSGETRREVLFTGGGGGVGVFGRRDVRAKTGLRKRRFVRLRTGPGCVRGPLRGRKGWWSLGGNTEGRRGEGGGWRTHGGGVAAMQHVSSFTLAGTRSQECLRMLRISLESRALFLSQCCVLRG